MDELTLPSSLKANLGDIFSLRGKVVFVPGGYGGIGEAICWGLALRGATVAVAGRNREKADKLVRELSNEGYPAMSAELDVKLPDSIRQSVDGVVKQLGRIDILVNCIGIQIEQKLLDVTEDAFDEVYAANLKGAMFLAQAVSRYQIRNAVGGRHVHLLSVRSRLGLRNRGYSAYCSTKGGLVMLVKQHAMELAPYGITVNAVAPTFVYTDLIRHVLDDDDFRKELIKRIPLGRIADPQDVVGPVVFFASPAAGFVTGQTLYVDGGITASQ
ncbi:MAG: SDR family oxidoreductase [Deltaproteobacteria bacterium]|nr:SDR family oxidoreductase [Deltaproteobacteria bacterium]